MSSHHPLAQTVALELIAAGWRVSEPVVFVDPERRVHQSTLELAALSGSPFLGAATFLIGADAWPHLHPCHLKDSSEDQGHTASVHRPAAPHCAEARP